MGAAAIEALALEGIAGFAANIANPLLLLPVVLTALTCRRDAHARIAAAGLGALAGLFDLLTATEPQHLLPAMCGAILAGLLLGELMLQVILPIFRLTMRIALQALSILHRLLKAIVE